MAGWEAEFPNATITQISENAGKRQVWLLPQSSQGLHGLYLHRSLTAPQPVHALGVAHSMGRGKWKSLRGSPAL